MTADRRRITLAGCALVLLWLATYLLVRVPEATATYWLAAAGCAAFIAAVLVPEDRS